MTNPTFASSRLTAGNLWFPDKVTLREDAVVFTKRRLVGGEEESIRCEQISSVNVVRGLFFAELLLETTGGSEPVYLNGLWIGDAEAAKRLLRGRLQHQSVSHEDRVMAELSKQTALLERLVAHAERGAER